MAYAKSQLVVRGCRQTPTPRANNPKAIRFCYRALSAVLAGILAIPAPVWAQAAPQLKIRQVGENLLRLELQGGPTNTTFQIQASTNLLSWETRAATLTHPETVTALADITPNNSAQFFRLRPVASSLVDTNPPMWTNGLGAHLAFQAPGTYSVSWAPALDNTGVAEYRIFLNGVLAASVPALNLSTELPIDPHQPTDLRIQAVDAAGNASALQPLMYLPGDTLVVVSDERGGVYSADFQTNGAFGALQKVATVNPNAWGVGLGDFDRDGILDVIAGGASNNTVMPFFFKGRGDGTFGPQVSLPTAQGASGYVMDAAVGDFDADGNLDFACGGDDRYVFFYWGNGDGTFTLGVQDWGCCGRGMTAGDFNEDGRTDIARATGPDGKVRIFLSNGDRTFATPKEAGQLGTDPYGVASADFDGDGHVDLIRTASAGGDVAFYKGLGDGTFTNLGVNGLWTNLDVGDAAALDAFDYDHDGHPDLVMSTFGTHSLYYYHNNGDGTFATNRQTISTAIARSLGVSAPPSPARTDISIVPGDPVATLNNSITFTAVGTGAGPNDTYRWTFGDETTNLLNWGFTTNMANMGKTISHIYPREGRFLTRLWHTSAGGIQSVRGTWAIIKGQVPIAVITAPSILDETVATNGLWQTAFYATNSTDDFGIAKYEWNFGNGTLGSGSTVYPVYSAAGTYLVTLTVTDRSGQSSISSKTITVKANGKPTPVVAGPRYLDERNATNGLYFGAWTGLSSTDDRGIYVYAWSFGDGTTTNGSAVMHAYKAPGLYEQHLTVTDFGNQTSTVTNYVTVTADAPPVAQISASTLSPEGAEPISFSAAGSSDDFGILYYRWVLPTRLFDFAGQLLDTHTWAASNVVQNDKLIVTGKGNWTDSHFYADALRVRRGGSLAARVDTPSAASAQAMIGLRYAQANSGDYRDFIYAINFSSGAIQVYDSGAFSKVLTNYILGASYDVRIETKPDSGARYFLRLSGTGAAFTQLYETTNRTDAVMGFGGSVDSSVFGFDDVAFTPIFYEENIQTAVWPGGVVTLEVVDNALQTNATTVLVTPITNAPPVAVFEGPTNAPAGVLLTYQGYSSTDDHGIASYTWDFGDGSQGAFGPLVSHAYPSPGLYTNTLTVVDYAGQQSVVAQAVFVGPGNQLVDVPWRLIGGIEYPHETYAGKTITLKAVARNLPLPFQYTWNFGDGTPVVTNQAVTAADAYGLQATHAYTGADGTPFNALVQVTLTNGTVLQAAYPILLRPKTLDVEMNVAIDEGLWYLHKSQNRYDIDPQNPGGYWIYRASGSNYLFFVNVSASAVQALAINGHLYTDDPIRDPYVETVQRGLNFLLTNLVAVPIGTQVYGDPDGNHNGFGLSANSSYPVYETGPVMDALVAAGGPELIAQVGGSSVKGRTFYDIMQDLVDMLAWGQSEDPSVGGGWRYGWNQGSDNSACQWAAIGMMAAERYWGVPVPQWVKQRNYVWLTNSCCFGYLGAGTGEATTPSGLVQVAFNGLPTSDPLWVQAEAYIAANWSQLMKLDNVYGSYAIAKSMRSALPNPVENFAQTGKNWFLDPVDGLARVTIDGQRSDGSWISKRQAYFNDPALATPWSVIILSSSIFQRGPVAVLNARPNPTSVGFPVVLDGRSSFHQYPARRIVEYRWDFDASDGLDFDHPDAYGPVVTNRFGANGTNIVTLQVRDNGNPQLSSTASVEIHTTVPPHPPFADAGGPYVVCVGQDVHLDGSGSFDVDAATGDYIQSYAWETDFQMPLDFNDGVFGVQAVLTNGFATAGQRSVGLRVTDATSIVFPQSHQPDLSSEDFATVYVYDKVITNLIARPKDTRVQLVWTAVGDYAVVMRSTIGPDRGFEEIGRTTSRYATFLDTNVQYNVGYYYRLFPYRNGDSDALGASDPVYATSLPLGFIDHGPVFTGYPPRDAYVGKLYQATLQASDQYNYPFAFNLLAGPANVTLDRLTGDIQFMPTLDQLGDSLVSFEVTNSFGTNILNFNLTVLNVTNFPPVANANGPYSGVAGQAIGFSSLGTFDPETNVLTYVWVFGDGSVDTNANPVHAYPAQGDYQVSLYVNDGHGGSTQAHTQAHVARANRIPIAKAGGNLTPLVGQTVRLDGSGSWDADLDPLTYQWDVILRPAGSTSPLLEPQTARPSLLIDRPGFYVIRLKVNDGHADSTPDTVTIVTANSRPVANAGPDQLVPQGQVASLDGTRSFDVDGNALNYRWTLLTQPAGSTATLVNPNMPRPSFTVDEQGLYVAELVVNDGLIDSAPARVRVSTGNLPPEIVSVPGTNALPGAAWSYEMAAFDPDGTNLTFTLVTAPNGLTLNLEAPATDPARLYTTNFALLNWVPTQADAGPHDIRVRVTDTDGISVEQDFTLLVIRDSESPQVYVQLAHGQIQLDTGQWAAQIGSTAQLRVIASDNVGVTTTSLNVGSQNISLDSSGLGSVVASNAGLWRIVATATDAAGNVGSTNASIFFYDPNATNSVFVQIHSPTNYQILTKAVPIVATVTNATDIFSYRVDFARAADVDFEHIAVEGPQFTTITNVILPMGVRAITDTALAQFDPSLMLNDDYVIRVVASDGLNLTYQPALVSVRGKLKMGEFHIEFTDLSLPVAGTPITITRVYDSRQAGTTSDFGYGWRLGIKGADIRKTLRSGTMFQGSRVYINSPSGQRIGFTTRFVANKWVVAWFGSVALDPDPGVYEKLEILGSEAVSFGDYISGGLFGEPFNPSTFRLTTKDGTVYVYDDTDGLKQVQDLHGSQLFLTAYGIFHFPPGAADPDQSVPFVRDDQGRIVEIVDPSGKRLTYSYDASGNLQTFADQATNLTQYFYSAARAHYLTNIVDPSGHSALQLVYDNSGRLVGVRDATGNVSSQDFPDANTIRSFSANGGVKLLRFDDNGNEVIRAQEGIYTNYFAFDANNNEIWFQDPRGFITTHGYDAQGNPTNLVDALTNTTSVTYNQFGQPTRLLDALGHATQFRYDSQGGLTNIINAAGSQAYFTRDAQGRVTMFADFGGNITRFEYPARCSCDKPSRIVNPDGSFRLYEYNPFGQVTRLVDEMGHETLTQYDDSGLLLQVRDAESNITMYAYAGGLKVSETDPLGRTTYYGYDNASRQIAVTNSMGGVIQSQYQDYTNLNAVIDPMGNVTRFYYDQANRLVIQVDPLGRTNSFAYDASGNVIETIDRNGQRRTFAYDGLNRRTQEQWWDGSTLLRTLTMSFNALGLITGATDSTSTVSFAYDALNRLQQSTQAGIPGLPDFSLSYAYDAQSNLVSVADNFGVQVTSQYDVRSRLTHRVWQGPGLPGSSLAFNYDLDGNRTNLLRYADSSGTKIAGQSSYSYDNVHLMKDTLHGGPAGIPLADYHYERDPAREIIRRTINNQFATFKYDMSGQLTDVTSASGQGNESYRYDPNGNRSGSGYIIFTNNQITADGDFTYSYDAEGNLVGRTNKSTQASSSYQHDYRNRLVRLVNKDPAGAVTQTIEYMYDALNRRIARRLNGSWVFFLLDRDNAWADADGGTGAISARYLLGNRTDEMLARFWPGRGVDWYLGDNLGTVRDVVSSSGAVANHVEYDAFGQVLSQSAVDLGDRFLFAGREWDADSGLYYFRARYYSPSLGRFIGQDPSGFDAGDFNLYRYVKNSPLGSRDPTGEQDDTEIAIDEIKTQQLTARSVARLIVGDEEAVLQELRTIYANDPQFRAFVLQEVREMLLQAMRYRSLIGNDYIIALRQFYFLLMDSASFF
ncbi:MAG TPA: PKD domain-containing protein [Verrucomicrobiae bacterium]|nr:PKD domain-containing protein [Verrucomicrobiae bacterium]